VRRARHDSWRGEARRGEGGGETRRVYRICSRCRVERQTDRQAGREADRSRVDACSCRCACACACEQQAQAEEGAYDDEGYDGYDGYGYPGGDGQMYEGEEEEARLLQQVQGGARGRGRAGAGQGWRARGVQRRGCEGDREAGRQGGWGRSRRKRRRRSKFLTRRVRGRARPCQVVPVGGLEGEADGTWQRARRPGGGVRRRRE